MLAIFLLYIGLVCASFAPNQLLACRFKTNPIDRAAGMAKDLEKQRDLIKKLAQHADTIVIAGVADQVAPRNRAGVTQGALRFLVQATLKGVKKVELVAEASGDYEIFCGAHASEGFTQVGIEPRQTYIVYAADGVILRAGQKSVRDEELVSFEEERLLVRRTVWRKKR
jgi:hypothetical protein